MDYKTAWQKLKDELEEEYDKMRSSAYTDDTSMRLGVMNGMYNVRMMMYAIETCIEY